MSVNMILTNGRSCAQHVYKSRGCVILIAMDDDLFSQQMPAGAHEPCVNTIILSSDDDEDVPPGVNEPVVEPANELVVRFAIVLKSVLQPLQLRVPQRTPWAYWQPIAIARCPRRSRR